MSTRSREVRFVLTGDERDLLRSFGRVDGAADRLDSRSRRLAAGFGTLAKTTGAAAAVIGGALVLEAKRATDAFEESVKVAKQTRAVIESTGGAAKVTAEDVERLAASLSKKAGVDDELIQSGENVLLTFKQIRNEAGEGNRVFDRATEATLNMSVALGKDMTSSAIQVGKALNDPIKGMTALGRAGVQFTEQQREQIAALVESGRTLQAQKIILRELESQFGGSAEAQARPLEKMKVAVENVEEAIGRGLSPVVTAGAEAIEQLALRAEPALNELAGDIEDIFGRKDLDVAAKFRISAESARQALAPFTDELGDMIRDADLPHRLEDAIVDAAPLIAEHMATIGVRAAGAFARAWMESDTLTRALLGAWVLKKTGALGAFRALGAQQGAAAAAGYRTAFTAGTAGAGAGRGVRGRAGALGAGALAAAGGPLGLATVGAVLVGSEAISQIGSSDDEKNVAHQEAKRRLDALNSAYRNGRLDVLQYKIEVDKLARSLQKYGGNNEVAKRTAAEIGREMQKTSEAPARLASAIQRMERSTSKDLDSTRTNVRITTKAIKERLGEDSEEGRILMARAFEAAAGDVQRQMRRAGRETKKGTELMQHYISEALQVYGISPRQARNIAKGDGQGGSFGDIDNNRGREGGHNRAGGGWIGQRGQAGGDHIPIMVGAGEAVLNRHQQDVIEGLLGDGFLDDLFATVTTPHYLATGGRPRFAAAYATGGRIVPVPGFPDESAASSVLDEIGWVTRTFGLRLTDAFGPGHKSPGHTQFGTAADFAGPDRAMDAAVRALVARGYLVGYDGRFGSQAWPNHGPGSHLHVEFGTRGGQPLVSPQLKRVRFPAGMGALSVLGQAGLDTLRAGGQHVVDQAVAAALATPVPGGAASPKMGAGALRRVIAQALRWTGHYSPGNAAALYRRVMQESGGDPDIVNTWDVNAQRGDPSVGLAQVIGSTFAAHRDPRLPNDRRHPLANLVAAIRYMMSRYGHIVDANGQGYARGGRIARASRGRRGRGNTQSGAGTAPGSGRARQRGQGPPRRPRPSSELGLAQDIKNLIAFADLFEDELALAELTPDTADDLHWLRALESAQAEIIAKAPLSTAAEYAPRITSTRDRIRELTSPPPDPEADRLAEAIEAQTAAMAALEAELKRNNDFADSVIAVTGREAVRALADVLSGEIVGFGYQGRTQSAGSGVGARY